MSKQASKLSKSAMQSAVERVSNEEHCGASEQGKRCKRVSRASGASERCKRANAAND